MSLPPKQVAYYCNSCVHHFSKSVSVFSAAPRFTACPHCRNSQATLWFGNALQKRSYQKDCVRKAGAELVQASEATDNKYLSSSLKKAGQLLRELP